MRIKPSLLTRGDHVTVYVSERVVFNKWYAKIKGIYWDAVLDEAKPGQQLILKLWIRDDNGRDIYIDVTDIAHVELNSHAFSKALS